MGFNPMGKAPPPWQDDLLELAGPITMHHSPSVTDSRRLRIASMLLLINRLLMLTAAGLLFVSLFADDRHLLIYGSTLVAISLLLLMAQWVTASHAGCPLCQTPVLAPKRCLKHRKARRLLGSYHLRVALAIMFTDRFRCPYCNRPSEIDSTEKPRVCRPRGSEMTQASRIH